MPAGEGYQELGQENKHFTGAGGPRRMLGTVLLNPSDNPQNSNWEGTPVVKTVQNMTMWALKKESRS